MKRRNQKKTQPKLHPKDELLEIEALLGKRSWRGTNKYLVKWKDEKKYSWEPEKGLPSKLVKWYDKSSFEVEALLEKRLRNGKNEYFIKWKDAEDNSWEPELNIDRKLVVDFETAKEKTSIQLEKGRDPKLNQKTSPSPARKMLKRLVKKEPSRVMTRHRSGSSVRVMTRLRSGSSSV